MDIDELKVKDDPHQKRIANLENQIKYAVEVSHTILDNMDYLIVIKELLQEAEPDQNRLTELWLEIDRKDRNNLLTAYSKGGAFTANERDIMNKINRGW